MPFYIYIEKIMRKILFSGMLICLAPFVFAQSDKTEGHIKWSEDYKLTWADFQAKPKKNHVASAMSDITFSVSVHSEGKYLIVYIQPSFNPKGSWAKEEDRVDELLKHEQIHFDIYEVNARKMRQELQMKKLTTANSQETVNNLMEKYGNLNIKVQERYDGETDHSLKKDKQEKWNEQITVELESLKDYSSPAFKVEIKD